MPASLRHLGEEVGISVAKQRICRGFELSRKVNANALVLRRRRYESLLQRTPAVLTTLKSQMRQDQSDDNAQDDDSGADHEPLLITVVL